MQFEVRVADAARFHARQIHAWYRERSRSDAVAEKWLKAFLQALASLQQSPERCPLARESVDFSYELFELHFGSGRRKTHRLLFRIDDTIIRVMAIRHFAQDDVTPDDV